MPDQLSQSDKNSLSRSFKPLQKRKEANKQFSGNTEDHEKIKENVESIKQLLDGMRSYLKK